MRSLKNCPVAVPAGSSAAHTGVQSHKIHMVILSTRRQYRYELDLKMTASILKRQYRYGK